MDGTDGTYRPFNGDVPFYAHDNESFINTENAAPLEVKVAPEKNTGGNGTLTKADDSAADESKERLSTTSEKTETGSLGFFQLFRFRDNVDVVLMVLGTLSAVGHGAAVPLQFIIFGELIDSFINFESSGANDIEGQMTEFALFYIYLAIANLIVAYGQMALWSLTAARQTKQIRLAFFRSVLKQDIGWFDTTDPGELNSRLSEDLNKVHDGIGQKIGMFVQSITLVLTGFIMGFAYGWKLTLVMIAVSPLLAIAGGIMGKMLQTMTSKELDAYAKAGSIAEEVLSSIRTVVAFGGEKKELARYSSNLDDALEFGVRKGITTGLGMGFFQFIIFGSYALAFWYGTKLVIDDEMSGGRVLIVFFSVMFGAMTLGQAGPNFAAIVTAKAAAYQVFLVIDRVPPIDSSSPDGKALESFKGDIIFKNVKFFYPSRPDVQILNGLNLYVDSGKTVALVGESGCGKSTLVKLVQRFYDPSEGMVMVDDHDIRSLNLKWLREHIGVVSQEPVLFGTTIAENIRYGHEGVTQEDIERATKMSNAHDFIMRLPQKYDTLVGERGTQLSGGQKQRIAIARALVKDPRILLLDEATSALDTESESIVQAALDRARLGRTTIVIAHRLSTVQNADVIAAVQDGVVVETGSHEELMQTDGVYHQLVTLQTFEEDDGDQGELDENETEDIEDKEAIAAVNFMRSMSSMSSGSEPEGTEFERKLSIRASRRLSVKRTASSTKERPKSAKEDNKKDKDEKDKVLEEEVSPASWLRIVKLNKTEWPYLLVGSIASLINGLFPFAFALVLSEILKVYTLSDDEKKRKEALFWSLMFLAIGVMTFMAEVTQNIMFAKSGEVLTMRLRSKAFETMLTQDISYFDDPFHSTGALTTALAVHASDVKGAAGSRLGTVAMGISTIVACVVYAFYNGWMLSLVVLGFIPFLVVASTIQMKVFAGSSLSGEGEDELVQSGKIAVETFENIRTVASLGREMTFYHKYADAIERPYKQTAKRSHLQGASFGLSEAFMFFANAATFRFGAYLVAKGDMTMDEVMKVILSIVMGGFVLGQISALSPDFMKAKVAAARLFKLFDRKSPIDSSSEDGAKPNSVGGTIQLRSVRFRYPTRPDVKVLRGISLSAKMGQKVALVGSSGCGKSTIVSLLERFYDVEDGEVAIDGYNVRSLNIQWLRSQIGIVSQEPVLFGCSIAENIAYGDNSRVVGQDEIEKASKAANIHSFINSLPQGYDTLVGDKGTLISGGQKQRIAIARALIRNPKILLLDEATSALDRESEMVVQQALDAASEGRTAIIIAHRLSTVQNADLICVIHHGRVVEQGKHQELLSLKGAYYSLVMAQIQSTVNN